MSSTSPRHGLSKTQFLNKGINTLRSLKTRFVVVFTLMLLTAVLSASALTASTSAGSLSSDNSQHAGIFASSTFDFLSLLGFGSQPGKSSAVAAQTQPTPPPGDETKGTQESGPPYVVGGIAESKLAEFPSAAEPASLWYNGDFDGGSGFANGSNSSLHNSKIFSDFVVPAGGWTITGLYSHNGMDYTGVTQASYEIRSGMSAGVGGTLLFSSAAAPATQVATGVTAFGRPEYTIKVTGLSISLPAGTYWVSVAPIGPGATGASYLNTTSGANAIGTPPGNNGNEFANSVGFGWNYQSTGTIFAGANDFSQGVITQSVYAFSSATSSVVEGNVNGTVQANYTITRTGDTSTAGSVRITSADGTAIGDAGGGCNPANDYKTIPIVPGDVPFAIGVTSRSFAVDICSDTIPEPTQTFSVSLSNPVGGSVGTPGTNVTTIFDDDTTVSVAIVGASSVNEGNVPPNTPSTITYRFTRNSTVPGAYTVNYSATGMATCGPVNQDYTIATPTFNTGTCTGTVTFGAADLTSDVVVSTVPDNVVEPDETVIITPTAASAGGPVYTITGTGATGTILNDDTDVTVAVAPASVPENGGAPLVYTFTRNFASAANNGALTVNFSVAGTACSLAPCTSGFPLDYSQTGATTFTGTDGTTPGAGSVTFLAGNTTATINVNPIPDTNVEPDETVIFAITAGAGYNTGSSSATGIITNDDTTIQFSSATYSGFETNGPNTPTPSGSITLTVTRLGLTTGTSYVDVAANIGPSTATGGTSCTAGVDYINNTGQTLTFGPGVTSLPFVVPVCGDTTFEADETFTGSLSNPQNARLGTPNTATVTILNDDTAPTLTMSGVSSQAEGNGPGTTNYVITVTKSAATEVTSTVQLSTIPNGGTATGGAACSATVDYINNTQTLSFSGPTLTQTFNVAICGDTLLEGNETFNVTASAPTNGTIAGTNPFVGTINNDDSAPTFSINDVTDTEGNSGSKFFNFVLTRTGDSQAPQTITYHTVDGPAPNIAQGGVACGGAFDYTTVISDSVTFNQGETSKQIPIIVCGDLFFEQNENFQVVLDTGGVFTRGTGLGTIVNDDTPPVVSIDSPSVNETDDPVNATMTFTVTRTGPTNLQTVVNYHTADGTSAASAATGGAACATGNGVDYISQTSIVTFAPNETTKTILITVCGDRIFEGNETMRVIMDAVTNATITPGTETGTGTIIDNETAPTYALAGPSPTNEGNSGLTPFNFTVTRTLTGSSTGVQRDVVIGCATADGTATVANNDYQPLNSSSCVTYTGLQSASTKTITVNVVGDTVFENDETFSLTISGPGGISPATQTATIVNDDTLTFAIRGGGASLIEGNSGQANMVFNIDRTGTNGTGQNSVVSYNTVDVTATGGLNCGIVGVDYVSQPPLSQVIFAPGDTTRQILVPICGDITLEPDETFQLVLTGATNAAGTVFPVVGVGTIINDDGIPISISGNIKQYVAGGPNTNLAGVAVALTGTNTQNTTTDANGNYTFTGLTSGGNFLITPTLAGKTFSPTTRSYSTLTTNVTNADFLAYNNGAVPRNLRVGNTGTAAPGTVTVPIILTAQGDEAALSFSLNYNNPPLSSPTVACGTDAGAGCTLFANTGTSGQIGISVEPAGGGVFAAGQRVVVTVTFNTSATVLFNSPITFSSVPSIQRTSDSAGNPLPTTYTNGFVVFQQGLEGDIAAPTSGDGFVLSNDVTVLRQIVVGNTIPDSSNNMFQRADVSPAATKGDGQIDATDITVERNYVAFQNLQTAGGPFGPLFPTPGQELPTFAGKANSPGVTGNRQISMVSNTASAGSIVFANIALESQGDEVGASFTVNFDTTRLSNPVVTLGTDVPAGYSLTTNVSQVAAGKIGVLVDGPANSPFIASPPLKKMVTIRFNVAANAAVGSTAFVNFSGSPTPQSVSDGAGNLLTTTYAAGTVTIIGPTAANVSISGRVMTPNGAGLRNATVFITDSMGNRRTVTTSSFGFYQFDDVAAGGQYILGVSSRSYRFNSRTVTVNDNLTDQDFTGLE